MRAIVIHEANDLRIEERKVAEPGANQVRVAIAAGGVCGSDLHYFNHGGFGAVRLKEPMILGHEVAGYIDKTGADVVGLQPGDLVAVSPSRPCGTCRFCVEGHRNHCLNMQFYGSAMPFPHIQGAFREMLIADPAQCVLANGLSAGEAAMAEPLAVCLHALRRAGDLVGKRVLVTGCGPIGALSILAARRAGASEIIATDLTRNALAVAKAAGADHVLDVAKNPDALNAFSVDKGTVDVMFECSGSVTALTAGIAALRPRGILVQLGIGGDMLLPMTTLTAKEIDLRGSFRFHPEFETAVGMIRAGLIDVAPLISHTLPLAEARAAFELANDRNTAMKVQIAFS